MLETLTTFDLNTLVISGIAIPPLLVFVTEYFKPVLGDIEWAKKLFPFLLGLIFAWIFTGGALTLEFLLVGFLFGALATGECKSLVKPLKG